MEASARFLVHWKSLMARSVAMQAGQSAARSLLRRLASIVALAAWTGLAPTPAVAQDYGLEGKARYALSSLAATVPLAAILEKRAYAILVFPDVTKAGFLIGGEYGNGVPSSAAVELPGTTTRRGFPTDCRRARRPSATRCSS